jgi:putative RNA 2'-phosphotransferase
MSKYDSLTKLSKFLSLVLRHKHEEIGLQLDPGGWAVVADLLTKMPGMTTALLDQIVAEDGKQRYTFSPDRKRIRAAQGHSLPIDLGLSPITPPDVLYHGTALRFLTSIQRQGLSRRGRQFVHLSSDRTTALLVGQRHGDPGVLAIDAAGMQLAGHTFYQAENGVWLVVAVPPEFLSPPLSV